MATTRRDFLQQAATVSIGTCIGINPSATTPVVIAAEPAPAVGETPELAALRKKAVQRRRRLIYNDDGCGPIMQPGGDTPEGFLNGANSRMRPVSATDNEQSACFRSCRRQSGPAGARGKRRVALWR
jgi:hypothetical protein